MNKLFTKIATLSVGLAMAIGVGVAIGSGSDVRRAEAASPASVTFSDLSLGNGHAMTGSDVSLENGLITFAWNKGSGSTAPTYYDSGTAVRLYCPKSSSGSGLGGKVTISLTNSDYYITSITYSFTGTVTAKGVVTAGSLAAVEHTLTANSSITTATYTPTNNIQSVVFQAKNTSSSTKQCYLSAVSVSYAGGSSVAVTGVTVSPTVASIGVGGTQQLTPTITPSDATDKAVTYSSSASGVASVSSTGLITGVATGSATITVTTHDGGFTATCSVTVTAPVAVTGVSLNKNSTTIEVGGTETLTATVAPNDASNKSVTWGTSASSVATVSEGVVTAVGVGTATITVTTVDGGFTAACSVKVSAPQSVTFIAGTDIGSSGGQYASTISKSGISIAFSSCRNNDAPYRIYGGSTTTISSSIGDIAKIEFNMNGSYSSAEFSCTSGGGTYVSSDSTHGVWTGSSASVEFTAANQARCNSIVITLASNDPLVELAPASSTEVSLLKGDTDTSVKVLVKNIETKTWSFTFDEDEQEGITTSSYISVSAGAAVSDVHTLTITTKAVGSTVLHISVSGTVCATTIPVAVAAKPASMEIVHGDIVAGELEVITGAYKQVSFSGEDTDGNAYAIAAGDVTPSATSGASHVTLSGSRITGASKGDAVVRYTLNALTSVYAEITVHVVDDYIESVGTPTFATGLTDTQGQSPDVSVFTSRPGTMHSGTSTTIPFENYKFSYTESYAAAEYGSVFSYDFSHGTTVDETHKLQTIYVFCDIDEAAHGSYTVTVEQFNNPLKTITFTNVTDNELSVSRGDSFQLEWAYDPENPTDGKEVEFVIDDNDDGIDITVSELGLISIGASSDLGTALVLIQSAHDDTIQDYVYVTAALESMKYVVNEKESLTPVSTVSSGDRVYMVGTATDHSNQTYEFNGYPGSYGGATQYTTTVAKLQLLVVEAGTETGTIAFKLSGGDNDGEYISYSGSSNTLNHTSTKDKSASWTVDGSTITNANTTARQIWLNWNSGTPRFACYTNKTSTTGYYCPTFIKVTGGNTDYNVTEDLFNGVHNNFGEGKTYQWDASCSSFDEDAWLDACVALTEITNYSSYKLNRAVGNIAGNEIEVFLAKYDIIIQKFGTTHDHLDRFASGGINYNQRTLVNPITTLVAKNSSTVIIVIVTVGIAAMAIGGYFLLRKKKED